MYKILASSKFTSPLVDTSKCSDYRLTNGGFFFDINKVIDAKWCIITLKNADREDDILFNINIIKYSVLNGSLAKDCFRFCDSGDSLFDVLFSKKDVSLSVLSHVFDLFRAFIFEHSKNQQYLLNKKEFYELPLSLLSQEDVCDAWCCLIKSFDCDKLTSTYDSVLYDLLNKRRETFINHRYYCPNKDKFKGTSPVFFDSAVDERQFSRFDPKALNKKIWEYFYFNYLVTIFKYNNDMTTEDILHSLELDHTLLVEPIIELLQNSSFICSTLFFDDGEFKYDEFKMFKNSLYLLNKLVELSQENQDIMREKGMLNQLQLWLEQGLLNQLQLWLEKDEFFLFSDEMFQLIETCVNNNDANICYLIETKFRLYLANLICEYSISHIGNCARYLLYTYFILDQDLQMDY